MFTFVEYDFTLPASKHGLFSTMSTTLGFTKHSVLEAESVFVIKYEDSYSVGPFRRT